MTSLTVSTPFTPSTTILRAALLAAALLGAAAVEAAGGGFVINARDEALVSTGMSRDAVRQALGRPAHNLKYHNEPGRTWTYGVTGSADKVFDVDFSADGKVLSTSERSEVLPN